MKVFLILKNEFFTRIKTKTFLVSTLLGPVAIAFVFVFAVYLAETDERYENILVVDETGLFRNDFKNTEKLSFFYDTQDMPDEVFKASPYTLMLFINEGVIETNRVQLFYKKVPSINHQAAIKAQLDRAIEEYKIEIQKIDRSTYDAIKSSVGMRMFDIKKGGEEDTYRYELAMVGFFFSYVILLFIISYSGMVMRGVTKEKQSRIVEILVSSVKPFQLMLGKILGIGLIGLTQIVLWIILSAGLLLLLKTFFFQDIFDPANIAQGSKMAVSSGGRPGVTSPENQNAVVDFISRINFMLLLPLFIFYFIFGYLLYGAIFAAFGAASDPDADSQLFSLPAFAPLLFAIFLAQHTVSNPESALTFWFSIFPLTSPVLMMVRVSMGMPVDDVWQLVLSMVLLVLAFWGTVLLAGKIYRKGLLIYGKRIGYKTLISWLKG